MQNDNAYDVLPSHTGPANPRRHRQVNAPLFSIQVPPFVHGWEVHQRTTINHLTLFNINSIGGYFNSAVSGYCEGEPLISLIGKNTCYLLRKILVCV